LVYPLIHPSTLWERLAVSVLFSPNLSAADLLATCIGRSVQSTTSSVIQIPTTTPPIIPKKITQPRKSVRYNLDSWYGTSRRPALFHAVLVPSVIQIPTTPIIIS